MAASWASVRGCASGSASAAAMIAASSSGVGGTIAGRLEVFLEVVDIVLHLSAFGSAETDDPSCIAAVNKGHVVQRVRLGRESDHAQLIVIEPSVQPHERGVPIKPSRQRQRHTVLGSVGLVLSGVEL